MLALSCWNYSFSINTSYTKKYAFIILWEPSAEYSSFYKYEDIEELNVEKFNKAINLGINAEDMLEMLGEKIS